MAHHLFIDKDPLRICPYDNAHRVCTSRFQYHLVKCRKNHPMAPIKICPFNATHHVRIDEYAAHIVSCPNAEIMENRVFPDRLADFPFRGCLTVPAYRNHNIPTDEDWEEELANRDTANHDTPPAPPMMAPPSTATPITNNASNTTRNGFPRPITIPIAARIAGMTSRPTFQEEIPPS